MYKIGQQILIKQGLNLVKAVVIDIDATFLTVRINYKKDKGIDMKININSKDILNPKGVNTSGFDFNNDFMRI